MPCPDLSLRRHYRLAPQGESDPLAEWACAVDEEALASSLRYVRPSAHRICRF